MKIIIAPDSFKGSLSAKEVCKFVNDAAKSVFPDCETVQIPIADGGEGTLENIIDVVGGDYKEVEVKNPLGVSIRAKYGILNETNAVIEMAQASGLPLLAESERNIMESNSFGTGELILDALKHGCKTIYVGLGGSATNDGGIGLAAALGVHFYDNVGKELEPIAKNLNQIDNIDTSGKNSLLEGAKFIIMSDVKNPLTGQMGATNVFGKQKGAGELELETLEQGMMHYEEQLKKLTGKDIGKIEGAGAAGGLGAGLIAFTDAKVVSGIDQVMKIVQFEACLEDADFVITGEGKMDGQSAYGKVVSGIAKCCKKRNVPCIALVGSIGEGAEALYDFGVDSMMATVNATMSLEEAMTNAKELCYQSAQRMFRMIKVGMDLADSKDDRHI